jgi:hypothetical protein
MKILSDAQWASLTDQQLENELERRKEKREREARATCTVEIRDRGPGFAEELCGAPVFVSDRCEKHAKFESKFLSDLLSETETKMIGIKKRLKELGS